MSTPSPSVPCSSAAPRSAPRRSWPRRATLKPYPTDIYKTKDHLAALIDHYAAMPRSSARAAIDEASEAGDADTADIFTAYSRALDKSLWFLEAHIQEKECSSPALRPSPDCARRASAVMISAAASAAMTAGRLSFTASPPIGETRRAKSASRAAGRLQEPAPERRLLGLRADHADIGGVLALQRFGDDQEIERVVMGEHDEGRAGRRLAHHLLRHRRQPRLDACRHAFQRVGARLDDDGLHRQQRKRRGQRMADMAAAEDIDMRPRAPPRPRAAASKSCAQRLVDQRDRDLDPPAAALADLGPERNVERHRARLADARRAQASAAPCRSP